MEPLNRLDRDSILSEDIFTEVFDQEDEIYKARLLISLEDRAAELGVKTKFNELVKTYKRVEREMRRKERGNPASSLDNWTNFVGPYDHMQCREWIATENGVCLRNNTTGYTDVLACYHPILPVERMRNLETGEEQIKLAYKRNGRWDELVIPKTMITSASKIVSLSGRGIAVTSENAKFLVRYLADVENANDNYIKVQYSSSKLGWIKGGFLPYDRDIIFDGDGKYRQIYESIGEQGGRNAWFDKVGELRRTGRIEIKFMLAASLASVLVKPLDALPFILDLWGVTEGGKSVSLMLAASVWANPTEGAYIKDYQGTDVGLEATCDLLNNLPLMLDDSSKMTKKVLENLENLVYSLCSGKGKTRSNKDLGINRENRWKNIILTNGEKPLSSYVNQGGAINRILELECGEKAIYEDPQGAAHVLSRNYGFAGKEFVQVLKDIGVDELKKIHHEIQKDLMDDEKMQKQSLSLSVILTADKIATEYLFKDGRYISIGEAKQVLIDKNELSDNERCYRFLLDKIAMNPARFDADTTNIEKWGVIENGYAIIYVTAFNGLCKDGGFARTSFLSWANQKGFIKSDPSRLDKAKRFGSNLARCVFLKLNDGADQDGFVGVDDGQMELPFD